MEANQDYITPTKHEPIFKAYCTAFGYIELGIYKDWYVKSAGVVGSTFALTFESAVNMLHAWIKDHKDFVKKETNCKFVIYAMDGRVDKRGDAVEESVYSIGVEKAKKYLL